MRVDITVVDDTTVLSISWSLTFFDITVTLHKSLLDIVDVDIPFERRIVVTGCSVILPILMFSILPHAVAHDT